MTQIGAMTRVGRGRGVVATRVRPAPERLVAPPMPAGEPVCGPFGSMAVSRCDQAGAPVPVMGPWPAPAAAWSSLVWSSLAARGLLAGQVVTAGVLGAGLAGQVMVAGLVRYVPGVSHVSLYTGSGGPQIAPGVLDRVESAGVGFVRAGSSAEAVRGANLVIVCDQIWPDLRIEWLSPHCVLVNATGVDLPDDLVDRVDAIYVDDAQLLDGHRRRYFVRSHLAGDADGSRGPRRPGPARQRKVRVLGDFGQVLTGRHRPHAGQIVLVELLRDGITASSRTPHFTP